MQEKVMLITGATSGIGKAVALRAANEGIKLIITGRREQLLNEIVEEIGPDKVLAVAADATIFEEQAAVVQAGIKRWGRIDIAFANAGTGISQAGTEKGDPDEWKQVIDININALLWTAKLTLPHLREQKGHFLLTSSVAGRTSHKGSIYGASKWFAYGFGINLSEEMAEWGGRCTTICPGMVNTPFFDTPKPDKLDPSDIADAVMYAVNANPRSNVREVFLMPTH
ncbi:MAG: SDR family oxidoreductase [Cellvibrionaceae bacterium]